VVDDAPQWPLGPFLLCAMGQGEENIPPGVVKAGRPASRELPEQHAGQKQPHADEASSGSGGSALKVHRLVAPRYITHPFVPLLVDENLLWV
jgi:hypothetical protein